MQTYRFSQCDLFYGTPTVLATLGNSIRGNVVITGEADVVQEEVSSGTDDQGMTADAVEVVMSVSFQARATAEIEKVLANQEGTFFLHRKDAAWALAFPAGVVAQSVTNDAGEIVAYDIELVQIAVGDRGIVTAAPTLTAGNRDVATGQQGYVKTAAGIDFINADHTQVANTVVVISAPVTAEGVN